MVMTAAQATTRQMLVNLANHLAAELGTEPLIGDRVERRSNGSITFRFYVPLATGHLVEHVYEIATDGRNRSIVSAAEKREWADSGTRLRRIGWGRYTRLSAGTDAQGWNQPRVLAADKDAVEQEIAAVIEEHFNKVPKSSLPPEDAVASAVPSADPVQQMERLVALRDRGVLTESEFQAAKQELRRQL